MDINCDNEFRTAAPLTGRAAEKKLHDHVLDMCVDQIVLEYLLPGGKPHGYETVLWDYKRNLPDLSGRGDEDPSRAQA